MEVLYGIYRRKKISSSWGIKVNNYMKFSERATLIISNDKEK